MTLTSNDIFNQQRFHPKKSHVGQSKKSVFVVKASPAEGRRRFHRNTAYAHLSGFNRPSHEGLLKVERREFRVFRGSGVLDESVIG